MSRTINYGLIGCGGFGRFCLQEYRRMPNVRCVAVADADSDLARQTASEHGMEFCASPEALIGRADIDLVHIATPPFTHAALAAMALDAEKHVLCEKPLAVSLSDAEGLAALAAKKQRVLAVNLIMRYNPLCRVLKEIVDRGVLGAPLYATLINAAQDENLHPGHWFWDRAKSGGIFIEHSVHFFDLFEWWFGAGRVVAAQQGFRPGTQIVEQVLCTAQYQPSTLATFYHGFHQMKRRDQQAWTIVFELGVLAMTEWVPTSLRLDVSVDSAALETLRNILPHADIEVRERYSGDAKRAQSRHRDRVVDVHAIITADCGLPKMALYGEMLRALLNDQIEAIGNPGHSRLISEKNGVASLACATKAQQLADQSPSIAS